MEFAKQGTNSGPQNISQKTVSTGSIFFAHKKFSGLEPIQLYTIMSTLAIVIDCWDPASPEFATLTAVGHNHYQHVIHNINHELAHSTDIVGTVFATYGVSALHPDLVWSVTAPAVWHHTWLDIPHLLQLLAVTGAHNILVMGCSWRACLFDRPVGIRRLFPVLGADHNIQIIPECCQNGNDDPSVILTDLAHGTAKGHWTQPYHWPNRYTLNHHNPATNINRKPSVWPKWDLLGPIEKLFSRR